MALFSRKYSLLHFGIPLVLALTFFSLTGRSFRRAPWYEEALWNLISPPQRLLSSIGAGVTGAWHHYFYLIGVEKENETLIKRIAELNGELIKFQEIEKENERLKGLLSYNDTFPQKTLVARVISNDSRAEFKSIVINKGAADGVEALMPVVGPRGLVGKIGQTTAHTARVLLITDPNSAVDSMVQRSRARGLVVGSSWHTELKAGYYLTRLEYLRGASDVHEGDVVVTSGLDEVFPPGLPVGTVHDLRLSRYGVFRDANVLPFEEMAELQEATVILNKPRTLAAEQ